MPGQLLLALCALVMLAAAAAMLRKRGGVQAGAGAREASERGWLILALRGLATGFMTGFFGVGGEFVLVPALVLILGLPMRAAVGTALLIIALNAVSGLVARLGAGGLDWGITALFILGGAAGVALGGWLGDWPSTASPRRSPASSSWSRRMCCTGAPSASPEHTAVRRPHEGMMMPLRLLHGKASQEAARAVSVPPPAIRLGLGANWRQFTLLVLVNAFVGGMVGLERAVLPLVAERDFGPASRTALLSFLISFGLVKAGANCAAGRLADRVGRRRVLLLGWLAAVPVRLMINQGLAWSTTVTMKIDLVGPARRNLNMGLNEAAGYGAAALAALVAGYLAAAYGSPCPLPARAALRPAGPGSHLLFHVRRARPRQAGGAAARR